MACTALLKRVLVTIAIHLVSNIFSKFKLVTPMRIHCRGCSGSEKRLPTIHFSISVKRSRLEQEQHGMTRPLKPLPDVVQQQRHESDEQFLRRLDRIAGRAFGEASVEQKYDVHVTTDSQGKTVVDSKSGADRTNDNYGARKRE